MSDAQLALTNKKVSVAQLISHLQIDKGTREEMRFQMSTFFHLIQKSQIDAKIRYLSTHQKVSDAQLSAHLQNVSAAH